MIKRLKLSILTSSDFPYGLAPENFVRQLSLGLVTNNVNLEVIRLYGERNSNINDTGINCTNYLRRRPFKNDFLKFLEVLAHILVIPFFVIYRKIYHKDHAIIMYGIDRAYFIFPFIFFSKLFKLKVYRINTEVYQPHIYANKWWRKPLVFFEKIQVKYLDKYLDGIIVLSNFLKKMELDHGVKDKNILLIPHFINISTKYPANKIEKSKQFSRIGYCGGCTIDNGILDLLDAFMILKESSSPNVELIIIGEITPIIQTEINKRSLKNVIFTGKLTSLEVPVELHRCDVLVNPRRSGIAADSGFPTKIGEYFAAEKTVVATNVGDLGLYFRDKKELIFAEPNNIESICKAMQYALQNKKIATEIALRGKKWAIDHLDCNNNSRKVIDFILKT